MIYSHGITRLSIDSLTDKPSHDLNTYYDTKHIIIYTNLKLTWANFIYEIYIVIIIYKTTMNINLYIYF